MSNNRIKLFKVFRILAAVCAACCGLFMLTALVTFGPMLFIKGNLTVEAGGLLGFFIDVIKEGENPIKSSDLVLSVLPRFSALLLLFVFFIKAALSLKRAEREDEAHFLSAKKSLRSLAVTSFLTRVAQNIVSPFFFNITGTDRTGWLILGLALLFFSFLVPEKSKNNNSTEEQI